MVQVKTSVWEMLRQDRWFVLSVFASVWLVWLGVCLFQPPVYRVDAELSLSSNPLLGQGVWKSATAATVSEDFMAHQAEFLRQGSLWQTVLPAMKSGRCAGLTKSSLQRALQITHRPDTGLVSLQLTGMQPPACLQSALQGYVAEYRRILAEQQAKQWTRQQSFLDRQAAQAAEEWQVSWDAWQTRRLAELKAYAARQKQETAGEGRVGQAIQVQNQLLKSELKAWRAQLAAANQGLRMPIERMALLSRLAQDPTVTGLQQQIAKHQLERLPAAPHPAGLGGLAPQWEDPQQQQMQSLLAQRVLQWQQSTKPPALSAITPLDWSLAERVLDAQLGVIAAKSRLQAFSGWQSAFPHGVSSTPSSVALVPMDEEASSALSHLKNRLALAWQKWQGIQAIKNELTLMQSMQAAFPLMEVFRKPELPRAPLPTNWLEQSSMGAIAGLVVALLAVLFRWRLCQTLRWPEQIRSWTEDRLPLFVLDALPGQKTFAALMERGDVPTTPAMKKLLQYLTSFVLAPVGESQGAAVRRIGVIPLGGQKERSMALISLCLSLTERGYKVALVDMDCSAYSPTRLMGALGLPVSMALKAGPGLSDYLQGDTEDFVDVVYPLGKTAYASFIPSGEPLMPMTDGLALRGFSLLEANLSPNYQFVFYSLPALDDEQGGAAALARHLDGVFLMMYPNQTRIQSVQSAFQELGWMGVKILGLVFQGGASGRS